MNSIYKNTLLVMCAAGLIVGCASKDVEYSDASASDVDQKIDKVVVSDDQSANSGMDRSDTDSQDSTDPLQKITNSSVNNLKSDINGRTVLLESVHFAFDKYNLSDEMRDVATANYVKIDEFTQSYSDLKIKLEGNCDEWGSDEYNYALGLKRAKATKDALVADGVDPEKIVMVSFGESNPICTQRNANCWKMNRRVDYRLLP